MGRTDVSEARLKEVLDAENEKDIAYLDIPAFLRRQAD